MDLVSSRLCLWSKDKNMNISRCAGTLADTETEETTTTTTTKNMKNIKKSSRNMIIYKRGTETGSSTGIAKRKVLSGGRKRNRKHSHEMKQGQEDKEKEEQD